MVGARRIASNHLLLKLLFLGLAAACLLGPLRLPSVWPWLDGAERIWILLLTGGLLLVSGILVRFALKPGIDVTPEGFTIQRMLGSASMRWDEVAMITPIHSYVGEGEWLALRAGQWGEFAAEGGGPQRRVFMPGREILVPSQFQAKGLRVFLAELLQRVPPDVLRQNEAAHQWIKDQVDGSGPLLMKLI